MNPQGDPVAYLTLKCEYLAAMLAAYDQATLGEDREQQTRRWLEAADMAIAHGWQNTPDEVSHD